MIDFCDMEAHKLMRVALVALFVTSVAIFAYNGEEEIATEGQVADLGCGFTDDFAAFIKNGTSPLI